MSGKTAPLFSDVQRAFGTIAIVAVLLLPWMASAGVEVRVVDFEDRELQPDSFYNGSDGAGGFVSGDVRFLNKFTDFGGGFTAWLGFAYSNRGDRETPGFESQFSAFPGGGSGSDPGGKFAVVHISSAGDAVITFPDAAMPLAVKVANTTFAALSMRDGDAFAKRFGGETGKDEDYLRMTIRGRDREGFVTGEVIAYLADFRFEDSDQDFIAEDWIQVDLSAIERPSKTIEFTLESTDVGEFGMNTPAYFALDDLVYQVYPWEFTRDLGDGWKRSAWFGDFHDGEFPWVFHTQLGWLLVNAQSFDDIWVFAQGLGWVWFGETQFPLMFRASSADWLIYFKGWSASRRFYNLTTEAWEEI